MEIKQLSQQQERNLLDMLSRRYSVDSSGAARLVIMVNTSDLIEVGIPVDPQLEYVVKVAIGMAGINQTAIESGCYSCLGHKYPLAAIPFMGDYVEIMERVQVIDGPRSAWSPDDREGFVHEMVDYYDTNWDEAQKMYDVVQQLDELNGETADNGQIGYTADRRIVAFDYGYDAHDDDNGLCSDLDETLDFYDDYILVAYLNALKNLVGANIDEFEALETNILNRGIEALDESLC